MINVVVVVIYIHPHFDCYKSHTFWYSGSLRYPCLNKVMRIYLIWSELPNYDKHLKKAKEYNDQLCIYNNQDGYTSQ